ncbi:hypothetical protein ABWI01_13485 [Oceanicaulis alexandrii]|uniref:hypothetical protein n=1 Tax=Oceanicaulis alexandrii TaxID=153233 RepID=UPI0035D039A2
MFARLTVYACALILIATGAAMLLNGPLWYELTPGVTMTGPYNPHFVLDIGFAFLTSGAVLGIGAWMGARPLMIAGLSWPALHAGLHMVGLVTMGPASAAALWTEVLGVIAPVFAAGIALAYIPVLSPGFGGRNLQHRLTEHFERHWSYDASYLHEIIEMAPDTMVRFQTFQGLAAYQGAAPPLLIAGATLGAMLEEDCGPCAQLTVDMLLARGVSPSVVRALIEGGWDQVDEAAALGFRFAQALMRRDETVQSLRDTIQRQYGQSAALAVAYAVMVARSYPLLKRALGLDQACLQLQVDGHAQMVRQS